MGKQGTRKSAATAAADNNAEAATETEAEAEAEAEAETEAEAEAETEAEAEAEAEAETSSISIYGLFKDFWLSTLSWIDISGVVQLSINVFLPHVQGAESHKSVIVLSGARPRIVSIARGVLTRIPVQLPDLSICRIGLDAMSPELARQGDERQLGMKLVSIEMSEKKITPENLFKQQQNGQLL